MKLPQNECSATGRALQFWPFSTDSCSINNDEICLDLLDDPPFEFPAQPHCHAEPANFSMPRATPLITTGTRCRPPWRLRPCHRITSQSHSSTAAPSTPPLAAPAAASRSLSSSQARICGGGMSLVIGPSSVIVVSAIEEEAFSA
jgi:hypothetical protein